MLFFPSTMGGFHILLSFFSFLVFIFFVMRCIFSFFCKEHIYFSDCKTWPYYWFLETYVLSWVLLLYLWSRFSFRKILVFCLLPVSYKRMFLLLFEYMCELTGILTFRLRRVSDMLYVYDGLINKFYFEGSRETCSSCRSNKKQFLWGKNNITIIYFLEVS